MYTRPVILLFISFATTLAAVARQQSDSISVVQLNQRLDTEVVAKNVQWLKGQYADDFVFTHGTGKVEGRESWLNAVARGNFISRQHDSVLVEMHPGIAIARGKLTVTRKEKENMHRYFIKYVRIYVHRHSRWQLLSHFTFFEQHEK